MANIKSSKKRAKTNEKRRMINVARRSDLKTAIKSVVAALDNNELEQAQALLRKAVSKMARAKGKGVLKSNTAARKISRLAKRVAVAAQ